MIPTPNSLPTMMLLSFGILSFIIFMLLPSIIELKKPKDPGPKIIKDYDYTLLHDLDVKINQEEREPKVDISILREIAAVLAFLPNLEA